MTSLRLWVQGDNTPKELRNQSTAAMMASFCQAGLFETCSHCHLGVGHTHEDVDGCLALVTTALGSEPDIQSPADFMRILRQKLGPLFHRNNMEFGVELVDTANWLVISTTFGGQWAYFFLGETDCKFDPLLIAFGKSQVREWTAMLPSRVSFSNCYLDRPEKYNPEGRRVPHSFTFVPRPRIPRDVATEERIPRNMQVRDTDKDVFAVIKMNMADKNLCQTPLLVYPGSMVSQVEEFLNSINTTTKVVTAEFDGERATEIRELADAIERDYPHLSRAVAFYRSLLAPSRLEWCPQFSFIRAIRSSSRWCHINFGERPLPPKPYHLQIRFHRGWHDNMGNRVREKHQLNGCLESLEYGKLSLLCKDDTAHIMFFPSWHVSPQTPVKTWVFCLGKPGCVCVRKGGHGWWQWKWCQGAVGWNLCLLWNSNLYHKTGTFLLCTLNLVGLQCRNPMQIFEEERMRGILGTWQQEFGRAPEWRVCWQGPDASGPCWGLKSCWFCFFHRIPTVTPT